jgi:hypothetical protein
VEKAPSHYRPGFLRSKHNKIEQHYQFAHPYQKNNRLVWDTTISTVNSLIEDVWGLKNEVVVDQLPDVTDHVTIHMRDIYADKFN